MQSYPKTLLASTRSARPRPPRALDTHDSAASDSRSRAQSSSRCPCTRAPACPQPCLERWTRRRSTSLDHIVFKVRSIRKADFQFPLHLNHIARQHETFHDTQSLLCGRQARSMVSHRDDSFAIFSPTTRLGRPSEERRDTNTSWTLGLCIGTRPRRDLIEFILGSERPRSPPPSTHPHINSLSSLTRTLEHRSCPCIFPVATFCDIGVRSCEDRANVDLFLNLWTPASRFPPWTPTRQRSRIGRLADRCIPTRDLVKCEISSQGRVLSREGAQTRLWHNSNSPCTLSVANKRSLRTSIGRRATAEFVYARMV